MSRNDTRYWLRELCSGGGGGFGSTGTAGYVNMQAEMTWGLGGKGAMLEITSDTPDVICSGGFGGRLISVDTPSMQTDVRVGDGGDAGLGSNATSIFTRGQTGGPGLAILRFNDTGGPLVPITPMAVT